MTSINQNKKSSTLQDYLRPSIILFLICLFSGLLLAAINALTIDRILQNEIREKQIAQKEVYPVENIEVTYQDKTIIIKDIEYKYSEIIDPQDKIIGYTAEVTTIGYNPGLVLIAGFTPDGKITGIRILKDDETPGLGKKAHGLKFLNQFRGMMYDLLPVNKAEYFSVKNNGEALHAISGATLTSVGVSGGVKNIVDKLLTSFNSEGANIK